MNARAWAWEFWDPARWQLGRTVRRYREWIAATRRRRWTARVLLLLFVLFVLPGALGAVATAQSGSTATGGVSQIDGLSWMKIRDSSGVPVSNYLFTSNHGGPTNPGATVVWAFIGVEFTGYIAIVTTAIWMTGYALSFRWLDAFASALQGVADALTGQVATPLMLATGASIGAFFVGWFVVRGYHAKAATQIVTMLGVAIIGPLFLVNPLDDVLSSNGLLTKGRDLGISVAAGLNGSDHPDPRRLVTTMQENLADNFARRPLQVWNFGHVVDQQPGCRSAWSAGVMSGNEGAVKHGMRRCGDVAALAKADNPTLGQASTGLMLLICSGILLVFAAYLGIKVVRTALDAIYHWFMSIFGFAASGFVYGPSQTFLVRNVVDVFIAAGRMAAFTSFLGVYLLFLGNLFAQAGGQVMAVIVIAGVVEIVAITQLRHLSRSLRNGNDWIANRFALAAQGKRPAADSVGGAALGSGAGHPAGAINGAMTGLAALSTINSSPIAAWLAAGTLNPLNPLARGRKVVDMANIGMAPDRLEREGWAGMSRANWRLMALMRAEGAGGIDAELGVANALDGLGHARVPDSSLAGALVASGANHQMTNDALRALSIERASMSTNPFGFGPLQRAVASARAVENHVGERNHMAFAAQAVVSANRFERHTNAPAAGAIIDHDFVRTVRQNWDSEVALRSAITPDQWNSVGRDTRWFIGSELAKEQKAAAQAYYDRPVEANRQRLMASTARIANLDHVEPGAGPDPWDP
ncbi:MAG: hypothetical protein HOQ24_08330 [Mycobacteriaceae bacterium]|nr:hypothetical protein [Mycobacteriaceae bacterium]